MAQDRACTFDGDGGLDARRRVVRIEMPDERLPAIVDARAFVAFEAALQIGSGAASLAGDVAIGHIGHSGNRLDAGAC